MHIESRCLATIESRLAEIVVRRCGEEANVAAHREGSEQRADWISGWQKCCLEAADISSFAPSNFEV